MPYDVNSNVISSNLKGLLNDYSTSLMKAKEDIFYNSNMIFRLLALKETLKTGGMEKVTATKDLKFSKLPTQTSRTISFPLEIVPDLDTNYTDIFSTSGALLNPTEREPTIINSNHEMVDLKFEMSFTKEKLQRMKELDKTNRVQLVKFMDSIYADFTNQAKFKIAYGMYNGGGFSSSPYPQWDGIENMFSLTSYGGISSATYPVTAPIVYDLNSIPATGYFGHTATTDFNTVAKLLDLTSSGTTKTPNVPMIFDFLMEVVWEYRRINKVYPDVIKVGWDLYNVLRRAVISQAAGKLQFAVPTKTTEELMVVGIPEAIKFLNTYIVVDDTSFMDNNNPNGVYLNDPLNIDMFYLKDFEMIAQEDDNFKLTDMMEVQMRPGFYISYVTATVGFTNANRRRLCRIKLPTALNTSGALVR